MNDYWGGKGKKWKTLRDPYEAHMVGNHRVDKDGRIMALTQICMLFLLYCDALRVSNSSNFSSFLKMGNCQEKTHVCVYALVYVCKYVCLCVYMCLGLCVWVYVFMYCACVCVCV